MSPSARRSLGIWLLVMGSVLLSGCPERHRRPENFSDDPVALLSVVRANAALIDSFSGQLRLEIWRGAERVRLRQLIATKAPDRLRIDVLSPFDQPLKTLVSDGRQLSIWAMDEKRFYRGEATAQNLARLFPVRLSPADLSGLLRGVVPMISFRTSAVKWDAERGRYLLVLKGDGGRQELLFEPLSKHLRRSTVWRDGEVEYVISLAKHTVEDGAVIPKRMRFEVPSDRLKIDIEVVDFVLNPSLVPQAWILDPPRGIGVESL